MKITDSVSIHDDVLQVLSKLQFPFKTTEYHNERPFIILTFAQLLDGSICYFDKSPMAISCPESKLMTHTLRSVCGGIVIGAGTLAHDNPKLTARNALFCTKPDSIHGPYFGHPLPIILDKELSINASAKLISESLRPKEKCVAFYQSDLICEKTKPDKLRAVGVEAISVEVNESDSYGFKNAVKILKHRFNLNSLMIEGGASVIQNCLNEYAELIDLVIITIRPSFATHVKPGANIQEMAKNYKTLQPFNDLKILELRQYGDDIVLFACIK